EQRAAHLAKRAGSDRRIEEASRNECRLVDEAFEPWAERELVQEEQRVDRDDRPVHDRRPGGPIEVPQGKHAGSIATAKTGGKWCLSPFFRIPFAVRCSTVSSTSSRTSSEIFAARAACPRRRCAPRCARSAWRCSKAMSTSGWSSPSSSGSS